MGNERSSIDVLIVVVGVGILSATLGVFAAISVPTQGPTIERPRRDDEVYILLDEIATNEEQYKSEHGSYLKIPACPSTPSKDKQSISSCKLSPEWVALKISPRINYVRCSYEVVVGSSTDDPHVMLSEAVFTPPPKCCATSWFILHAMCDMDGDSVYSHYVYGSFNNIWEITKFGE